MYLTSHDILSDKPYSFHFASPTDDVLTTIIKFASQALDKNGKAWAMALDLWERFDRI